MKKVATLVLVVLLMLTTYAWATTPSVDNYTDEELAALLTSIQEELNNRGATVEEYTTLQVGSNGEEVRKLQARLIELNYLSGSADGAFGNMTRSAVELFQKEAGMEVTGIADPEMQKALYAEDAPVAKVYLELEFKAISRDPDAYTGKNYRFTGKVLQVMEEAGDGYTFTAMRIATKNNYDDVVYVFYIRPDGEARILEDDRVTVYGMCEGLYSYETVMGATVTLPEFFADTITLNS